MLLWAARDHGGNEAGRVDRAGLRHFSVGLCGDISPKYAARKARSFARRLVIFEPMAERGDTGLQLSDIEGMMGSRINGQSDCRAIRPCMRYHLTAAFRRGSNRPRPLSGPRSAPSSRPRGCRSRGNRRSRREAARRNIARPSRDRPHRAPNGRPSIDRERRPAPDRQNPAATDSAAPRTHRTPARGTARRRTCW